MTAQTTRFLLLSCLLALLCLPLSVQAEQEEEIAYTPETIQEEITQEVTVNREQTAEEDPLAQRQSDKVENPALHEIMPDRFNFYTSLRMRYRETKNNSLFGDGGTRVGSDGALQFIPDYWVLGRLELGFNLFDHLDQILDPGSRGDGNFTDNVFLRLGYAGIEFPRAFLTYGKNWSTYYQVASFTDRFQGTGGDASGAFNAETDGGPSGTGRADQVWQTRLQITHPWTIFPSLKPFNINLQYQAGEKIPHGSGERYQYSFGISAILDRTDNFKTGIALNYSGIDNRDQLRLSQKGIDGDNLCVIYGIQWFGEKWYWATVFSYLRNHMATDTGHYFDAWGSEGYAHYQLYPKIWLTGGWNYLQPFSSETEENSYTVRYMVIGLRYTFKDFQRMIYANIRFDNSRISSDPDNDLGNTFTVGVRWDFDW